MSPLLSFFFYTPIPWAAILCIILYRHDLSQLMHPVKERNSLRDWKSVFQDLGIAVKQSPASDVNEYNRKKKGGGTIMSLIRRTSEEITERYPNARLYSLITAVVAFSSLTSSLVFGETFLADLRFGAVILVAFQFCCALPLIAAMQRYFGPFPSAPHKYFMKQKRVGSLLRYDEVLSRPASSGNDSLARYIDRENIH
jgi:hypothetical protein